MGDLDLHLAWMQLSIPYTFAVLFLVLERVFKKNKKNKNTPVSVLFFFKYI